MPARQYLVRDPATGELVWSDSPTPPTPGRPDQPWISDSLGFLESQLPAMEEDRRRNNFSAVEFVPDPQVPGFVQVKIEGKRARDEYIAHRQKYDQSQQLGSAATLSPELIEQAKRTVGRRSRPVVNVPG